MRCASTSDRVEIYEQSFTVVSLIFQILSVHLNFRVFSECTFQLKMKWKNEFDVLSVNSGNLQGASHETVTRALHRLLQIHFTAPGSRKIEKELVLYLSAI